VAGAFDSIRGQVDTHIRFAMRRDQLGVAAITDADFENVTRRQEVEGHEFIERIPGGRRVVGGRREETLVDFLKKLPRKLGADDGCVPIVAHRVRFPPGPIFILPVGLVRSRRLRYRTFEATRDLVGVVQRSSLVWLSRIPHSGLKDECNRDVRWRHVRFHPLIWRGIEHWIRASARRSTPSVRTCTDPI